MAIKQGVGVYLGPDNKYHFDQNVSDLTADKAKQITCVLKSLDLQKIEKIQNENGYFDIPFDVMIKCVNKINSLTFNLTNWPDEEWESITDKITGEIFDICFWVDGVWDEEDKKKKNLKEDEAHHIARLTIYKTIPDPDNKGLLKTDTSKFRSLYAMYLVEENENAAA